MSREKDKQLLEDFVRELYRHRFNFMINSMKEEECKDFIETFMLGPYYFETEENETNNIH